MIEFDIELILRSMGQRVQTIVVEFTGQIGLGILIDDRLPNRVDLTAAGRQHIWDYVPRDLRPHRAVRTAADGIVNRVRRR